MPEVVDWPYVQWKQMKVMVVDLWILEVSLLKFPGMDEVRLVEFQIVPLVLV